MPMQIASTARQKLTLTMQYSASIYLPKPSSPTASKSVRSSLMLLGNLLAQQPNLKISGNLPWQIIMQDLGVSPTLSMHLQATLPGRTYVPKLETDCPGTQNYVENIAK